MAAVKKRPFLRDPWRFGTEKTPEDSPEPMEVEHETLPKREKDLTTDLKRVTGDTQEKSQTQSRTVTYPNYGGITVQGTDEATAIGAAVLEFCVKNLAQIENTLLEYGILVTRINPVKLNIPFFITREDGWCLAIPDVTERNEGLLLLIQALLKLDENKTLKEKMRALGLQPYRL